MKAVGVIGATGYTGQELLRILARFCDWWTRIASNGPGERTSLRSARKPCDAC